VVRRALIYLLHFLSRTFLAGNRFVFESTADWNEEFSLRTCLRFTASPWPQEKLSLPRRHTNTQTQCSICTAHWCPCSKAHPPLCLIRPQWQCSFNNSTNCVSRQKPLITFRAPANGEIAVGFRLFFPRPTVRMRDMAAGTAGAAAVGHFPFPGGLPFNY